MESSENFLEICLLFNTNTLSRTLVKLAEKEFKHLELSPAHASLLLLVYDRPGISPKQLSAMLNLTPSTITRFIDSLEKKHLVQRETQGKSASISPTKNSLEIKPAVALAYKTFFLKIAEILGDPSAARLSFDIFKANKKLSDFLN